MCSYAKILQGECITSSLLECFAESQPILCKDRKKYQKKLISTKFLYENYKMAESSIKCKFIELVY